MLATAALFLAFAAPHLGLATRPVRGAIVARLGERGFFWAYSILSAVLFVALVTYYADHRSEAPRGLTLAAVPVLREALLAIAFFGMALAVAGLVRYPALPVALFGQPIREARGLERITRHPFFSGIVVFAVAHTLLASSAADTVFFAGLAGFSAIGAWHQDRKHLLRRPEYAAYLQRTSLVPFAAVLRGRQRLVARDVPWTALAFGAGATLVIRHLHAGVLAHHGAYLWGGLLLGAALLSALSYGRARRSARD